MKRKKHNYKRRNKNIINKDKELKAEQDKTVILQPYDLNLFFLVKVTLMIMDRNIT